MVCFAGKGKGSQSEWLAVHPTDCIRCQLSAVLGCQGQQKWYSVWGYCRGLYKIQINVCVYNCYLMTSRMDLHFADCEDLAVVQVITDPSPFQYARPVL